MDEGELEPFLRSRQALKSRQPALKKGSKVLVDIEYVDGKVIVQRVRSLQGIQLFDPLLFSRGARGAGDAALNRVPVAG
ncbi:hypothetical protein V0R50_27405 [Pseudomonas sp. 148P]|uniref:Uncharacterized protein n=1 Tax=Pseudomonas ulcerans TaxID=3115852 RepID=A0ABU7HZH8_9PSED|nr:MULTISPECIES: hypothetical protein [unclassified Pseudomonas]MEE1925005.1 hypothetical protein [Pseudomonas sp. 147P]MEE1936966.1 hypothetical protein [Pseudomonas sp. 148P]